MRRFLMGVAAGAVVALAVVAGARPGRAAEPRHVEAPREETSLQVRVTPEMVRYSYTRYALYFIGTALNAAVLFLLLKTRASARLRDLAERRTGNRFLQAAIYYPLLMLVYGAVLLPFSFYSSFLLPHQYGLSTQSLGLWAADRGRGYAIGSALGVPVVALLFWTLRRSPRKWWLGFWLASIPLLILAVLLGPLVIDPLYNKFEPMQNERLRDRLLALAARAGIERGRVFQVDASRRTKAVNAYVTGIGGSARIVLWDTLLQKLDEDEIAFIMGHEMGHYVEHHVPLGVGLSIAGTLFLLLLTDRTARWAIGREGERWGIRGMDDYAALPLFLLILAGLNFVGSPVENAVSRTMERRADDFGLRLTGNGRAAASSFVKLAEENLSLPNPPPFIEFWMFSHPPLNQRITNALAHGSPSNQESSGPEK